MHDRGQPLLGHRAQQLLVDLVDHRDLTRLRLLELGVPALELALDVALPPTEVTEPDGVDVDGVELGQDVDQGFAGHPSLLLAEHVLGRRSVAQDVS